MPDKICKSAPGEKGDMERFWDSSFREHNAMWGFEPAHSAILCRDYFLKKGIKEVLIPGIGYGRNAGTFIEHGIQVTGIEISKTAVRMAEDHYGSGMKIYQGSVTDMPFNEEQYSGIFCYGLIHLLDLDDRRKLIQDCYRQLPEGGYMVFTSISKDADTYGRGTFISKDRYEMFGGARIFFYDEGTIKEEFGEYGLIEVKAVEENYPFHFIVCCKRAFYS